ncbi:Hypothetical protein ORPV_857 [Orpheovirus IHUMI-LCC2]|uniref:Uncharacterized protein n=1 Tax=Orpheovirus IHUMI-LCC2 TaxID=2023057 RepID=A0A2I2L5H1_9VIRU|nr:Hypothetical protein ORPV_857 [Orpheovirus IHUMI-LCC2]SNW62761.1 Hypothetical protein ORPV_857 [Orpheovirus IHUMI-LCC2]
MQDILAPNSLFPYLPKELNKEILDNINPEDIPALCTVITTSNIINTSNCGDVIKKYYGEQGLNIIKNLTLEEFTILNNLMWPKSNSFDIINDNVNYINVILERAFSLRYNTETLQELIKRAYIMVNNNFGKEISMDSKLLDKLIRKLSIKYNRSDIEKINRDQPVYAVNAVASYLENGGDPSLLYNDNVASYYKNVYDLIRPLLFCTFPKLAFNNIKKYFLAYDNDENNEFLRYVYSAPLDDVHRRIESSDQMIQNNSKLKRFLFIVYTQRDNYNYGVAAFLLRYTLNDYISYAEAIKYSIGMDDIMLYKAVTLAQYGGEILFREMEEFDFSKSSVEPIYNEIITSSYENDEVLFVYKLCEFIKNNRLSGRNFNSLEERYIYDNLGNNILEKISPIKVFTISLFSNVNAATKEVKASLLNI